MVKVNYTADNDGYHVDRHIQDGFIDIPSSVVQRTQVAVAKPIVNQAQVHSPLQVKLPITITPTDENQDKKSNYDLVASIISQLTPHIQESVSTSLDGNSGKKNIAKPKPNLGVQASRLPISNPTKKIATLRTQLPKPKPILSKPVDIVNKRTTDYDLVSKIIGQLTPHIKESVSSSLSSDVGANRPPSELSDLQEIHIKTPYLRDSVSSNLEANNNNQNRGTITQPSPRYRTPTGPLLNKHQATDENIADSILAKLTPSIVSNVRESLSSSEYKTSSSSPSRNYKQGEQYININQGSDENIADAILAKLTPSIISNVRKSLDSTDFITRLSSQPSNYQIDKESVGLNQASDQKIADDILAKLTPSIISNVRETFESSNYGTPLPSQSTNYQISKQSNNPNQSSDQKIADDILAKLTPSIVSNLRTSLDSSNYGTDISSRPDIYKIEEQSANLNQAYDQNIADTILAKLAPSIISNVRKSLGENEYRASLGSYPNSYQNEEQYPGVDIKTTDEELAEKILGELSPFIEGSLTTYLSNKKGFGQPKDVFEAGTETTDEDTSFVTDLVAELTPTIQTLTRNKLRNEQKNAETSYASLFKGK